MRGLPLTSDISMLTRYFFYMAVVTSLNANALITRQYDRSNDCELYSVINKERNAQGRYVLKRDIKSYETIVDDSTHYGLETNNLAIDFDQRKASFEIISQVAFGFNSNLLGTDGARVSIRESNEQFNQAINQVNRKLFSFTQVCIRQNNEVIYFKE
jgi:hypothetical protein